MLWSVPSSQWSSLVPDFVIAGFSVLLCTPEEHPRTQQPSTDCNTSHTFLSSTLLSPSALLPHTQWGSLPTISVARMVVRIVPFHSALIVPRIAFWGSVWHLPPSSGKREAVNARRIRAAQVGFLALFSPSKGATTGVSSLSPSFLCLRYCCISPLRSWTGQCHEDSPQKQDLRGVLRLRAWTLRLLRGAGKTPPGFFFFFFWGFFSLRVKVCAKLGISLRKNYFSICSLCSSKWVNFIDFWELFYNAKMWCIIIRPHLNCREKKNRL